MHSRTVDELLREFSTDPESGLTEGEAARRLAEHGPNELKERPRPGFLALLFNQFKNFLIIILLIAAAVSIYPLGEYFEAGAIVAIVVLNAVLGVFQEARAENALAALKKMAAPNASVVRGGRRLSIPARELVPGDVVVLEAGNYIPADVRLTETVNLKVEEASLTGESVPVHKDCRLVLDKDIPLGDRRNLGFMGTLVTYGRGRGVVAATGMDTQIGKIAEMLQEEKDELTPLQENLKRLGIWLGIISLAVCGVIFVIGIFRDTNLALIATSGLAAYVALFQKQLIDLFMTAVSLAIAAVPEGLPAVVTVCLALGMQHMVRRHALIRKLPAVETLGCATVICSDKTGTLTQNAMTVAEIYCGGKITTLTGEGYEPEGDFLMGREKIEAAADPDLSLFLHGALLCNDAHLDRDGGVRLAGDPTEGALVVAALKAGYDEEDLRRRYVRIAEAPFDSDRKLMSTVHGPADSAAELPRLAGQPVVIFVKGAPDMLLARCTHARSGGRVLPLSDGLRADILARNGDMAGRALRVLGVAMRALDRPPSAADPEELERDLVFLGLAGMIDPARPEVGAAIALAKTAGIRTVMVTGDYKDTAVAIGGRIGLLEGGRVLAGAEIDAVPEERFAEEAESVDVFARVSPEHKVKIVDALRDRGHVVAMTGDGVNDAPALKKADIGVAMGITGTDVSKETADVVLTDDNYASIVAAIEQGRIIFSNIRKFVLYLLTCNVGEILIIFISILSGLPAPLTPIMLLWLNLVTDGAPALALGMERGETDVMKRPPRPRRESVVNRDTALMIGIVAAVDTGAVLLSYWLGLLRHPGGVEFARTIAFTTLVCSELLRAFTSRSEYNSVFTIGPFSNRSMLAATGISLVLLLAVVYLPFLQPLFGTRPLGPEDWLLMAPFMLLAPFSAEILKIFLRWKLRRRRDAR
ncbi:MAG: cation-translocating P-type ATPase [Spirochaetales bacterium]|nr:cation-translocating P-type ATPase [Spirochaetales bacterium]